MEYKYVKSKTGCVVPRYGTVTLIGCKRLKEGYQWHDNIVRIPIAEWTRYIREYTRALNDGSLILAQKKDFEAEKNIEKADMKNEKKAKKSKKDGTKHPQ